MTACAMAGHVGQGIAVDHQGVSRTVLCNFIHMLSE